jgi:predicted Zn finger-like uncharacterized protein
MSLATRCTSCGTVFRVVQDQLKVSEGWVRCGRCDEVFNALEGLFDLGRDSPDWERTLASTSDRASPGEPDPAPTPGAAPPPPPSADVESGDESTDSPIEPPLRDLEAVGGDAGAARQTPLADDIDAHLFRNRRAEGDKAPKDQVDARDRLEFSDARFDSDLFAESSDEGGESTVAESIVSGSGELPLESAHPQPDFIRRAERRTRWRSGPMRGLARGGCALGALLLVLQVGHHFRDTIAASWPSTRPLLAAWCKAADCTLEAPRRIDELSVESTALTRAIGLDAFILSVSLRSRSTVPLTLPSIDLSLTDGNGRLLARRALSPRDFSAGPIIAPGSETPLQLMLDAKGARVAGYTVEIFYP